MIDKEKREVGGWWLWILALVIASLVALGALNALGVIGKTAVERVVFEQSYQKKAGDSAKLATFRAQKAELESQLRRQDLTESQRADYRAQLSAINIQIATIEGK